MREGEGATPPNAIHAAVMGGAKSRRWTSTTVEVAAQYCSGGIQILMGPGEVPPWRLQTRVVLAFDVPVLGHIHPSAGDGRVVTSAMQACGMTTVARGDRSTTGRYGEISFGDGDGDCGTHPGRSSILMECRLNWSGKTPYIHVSQQGALVCQRRNANLARLGQWTS